MDPPKPDIPSIIGFYKSEKNQKKITSKQITDLLDLLSRRPFDEKFYLIGGAAVQLTGLDRETQDIDIVFDQEKASPGASQSSRQTFITKLKAYQGKDGSGFVVFEDRIVYWYNKPKPSCVILLDMHYSTELAGTKGGVVFPVMPSIWFPVIPHTGISIAPPLLLLCLKLIAADNSVGEKREKHGRDIWFLLSVSTMQTPALPQGYPTGHPWAPVWTIGFPSIAPPDGQLGPPVPGGNGDGMVIWIQARKI